MADDKEEIRENRVRRIEEVPGEPRSDDYDEVIEALRLTREVPGEPLPDGYVPTDILIEAIKARRLSERRRARGMEPRPGDERAT